MASMSSMRRRKLPPAARASSAPVRAEKAWPRCSGPVGDGAKRVRSSAVAGFEAAGSPLLAGLVDEDPGEQDEHRVGEAAREDDRRDPDEEGDDGDDGAAGEEDRQRREEEGEDVVHGG